MAGYEGQKFLHRLARSGGIISSLGMENDSSVGTRPGYSEKGKKVEMCTEPNNLGCPILLPRSRSLMTTPMQVDATENITVRSSRNTPTEGADFIPPDC